MYKRYKERKLPQLLGVVSMATMGCHGGSKVAPVQTSQTRSNKHINKEDYSRNNPTGEKLQALLLVQPKSILYLK